MFKKFLASLGFGSASVDTRLHSNVTTPGGTLSGVTHVLGGEVELEIDDVYLYLVAQVKRESGDSHYYEYITFHKQKISDKFKLYPKEQRQFPFTIYVPHEIPITRYRGWRFGHGAPLAVKTGLDIDDAVDKTDLDPIEVEPHPAMTKFLEAVDMLGFTFNKVDLEYGRLQGSNMPFFQELEYKAYHTRYAGKINELEVSFIGRPGSCEVVLEIDKRGFFGSSHDTYRRLVIDYNNYQHVDFAREIDRVLSSL